MNSKKRFGIVIGCLIAALAVLAFAGVNFAEKPVSWMPTAFLIVVLLLAIGILWTINPFFVNIQSIGMRYSAQGIVTFIVVFILACLAYGLFGNLWFLFGGSL